MVKDVDINVNVKTDKAEANLGKLETKAGDFKNQLKSIPGPLGAIGTAFTSLKAGVKGLTLGFRGLAGAIAATGLTVLLIAVIALVSWFKKTEKGAQTLRVITAALGAAIGAVTDVVISLGEKLVKLFTEPQKTIKEFADTFKKFIIDNITKVIKGFGLLGKAAKQVFERDFAGAIETAKEGVIELADGLTNLNPGNAIVRRLAEGFNELGKEIRDDVEAATKLENALNKVKVTERDLGVQRAKNNLEIEKGKSIAKDLSKSLKERQDALEKVIRLETELVDKEIANEKERLRIFEAQNELSASGEEDLQRVADQKAKVFKLETASFKIRTLLQSQLNALGKKGAADEKKAADEKNKRIKKAADDVKKAADKKAADEKAAAVKKAADDEKAAAKELKLIKQIEDSKLAIKEEGREKEIESVQLDFERKLEKIIGNSIIENELRAALKVEEGNIIQSINDNFNAIEKEREKEKSVAIAAASLQATAMLTSAVSGLINQGFNQQLKSAEGNEEQLKKIRKKQFESNKALQLVTAIIATAQSVMMALSSSPPPVSYILAAANAAAGAIQIAAIASARFSPGGGSSGTRPSAPQPPAISSGGSQPNISFAGSGSNLNNVGGGSDQFTIPIINANVSVSAIEVTDVQTEVSELAGAGELSN